MKTRNILVTWLFISTFLFSSLAIAQGVKGNKSSGLASSTDSATEISTSSVSHPIGLGYASGTTLSDSSAASLFWKIDSRDAIQFSLGIPSSSPFRFSLGAQYKYTVSESQNAGFHIGGGLGLGVARAALSGNGTFAFAINPLAGIHFSLADHSHLLLSVDGGPNFTIIDGNADFTIGTYSSLLGFSLIYML